MKKNILKKASCLAAGVLALTALPVAAQIPGVSDSLIVYDPSGKVAYRVDAPEPEDPTAIYSINVPGLVDPGQFGNATTLVEPGGSPLTGPYSDIFGVASLAGGLFLAFNSDGDPE